jgi:hypothetical protein
MDNLKVKQVQNQTIYFLKATFKDAFIPKFLSIDK